MCACMHTYICSFQLVLNKPLVYDLLLSFYDYWQVMERCGHLLASPSVRLRLLVLDTISQCLQALQGHKG